MTHSDPFRGVRDTLVEPSVAEVVRLFEVVAGEDDITHRLEVCVDDLHAVRQAKDTLMTVDGPTLRAALAHRAQARGGSSPGGSRR